MKLSKPMIDIISHRMGVCDAIVECLRDVWSEDEKTNIAEFSEAELEAACVSVSRMLKVGDIAFEKVTKVELEIIIDCLEGSTLFADSEDAVASKQITRGQLLAWHKAANELESAVSAAAGSRVNCARH